MAEGQNRALYQFTMQDTDTAELYKWAPLFETKIRQTPGFEDVNSDLQLNNPQVTVEMNRDKLSTLGLSATQVENALYNAYGTRQVSQIYAPNNQYQVILRVAPQFQRDPAAMSLLHIRSNSGRLIPLESVAQMKTAVGSLPGQPLRPAAGGDHRLQPGARVCAGRCGERDSNDGRVHAARDDQPGVPGDGAGVPGFIEGPRVGAR